MPGYPTAARTHGLSSFPNGENEVRCTVKEKIEFGGIWESLWPGEPWYLPDFPLPVLLLFKKYPWAIRTPMHPSGRKRGMDDDVFLPLYLPSVGVGRRCLFHHVTAGLLYKGNCLNRSLSAGSDSEQLANISVEELDGKEPAPAWEVSHPREPDHGAVVHLRPGPSVVARSNHDGRKEFRDSLLPRRPLCVRWTWWPENLW